MKKETAQQDIGRGLGATLRALKTLREMHARCSRCRRDEARHFINLTSAGEPAALCPSCFQNHSLDRRIARQRETRAAMRGRG